MLDIGGVKVLIKSTLCQTLKNPARQGSKDANKRAYPDVSDRSLHFLLTQQAENPSSLLLQGFFAFAGFVSDLTPLCKRRRPLRLPGCGCDRRVGKYASLSLSGRGDPGMPGGVRRMACELPE